MAVNVDDDIMKAEDILRHTADAAHGVGRDIVIHVTGHVHFLHKRGKLADISACKVINPVAVFSAVEVIFCIVAWFIA